MPTWMVVLGRGYLTFLIFWGTTVWITEIVVTHIEQRRKRRIERQNRPPQPPKRLQQFWEQHLIQPDQRVTDQQALLRLEREALPVVPPGPAWGRKHATNELLALADHGSGDGSPHPQRGCALCCVPRAPVHLDRAVVSARRNSRDQHRLASSHRPGGVASHILRSTLDGQIDVQ